jgi:hypothetical protein
LAYLHRIIRIVQRGTCLHSFITFN